MVSHKNHKFFAQSRLGWIGVVIMLIWIVLASIFDLRSILMCDLDSSGSCNTPELLYGILLGGPLLLGSVMLSISITNGLAIIRRVLLVVVGSVILTFLSWYFLAMLTISIHGLG